MGIFRIRILLKIRNKEKSWICPRKFCTVRVWNHGRSSGRNWFSDFFGVGEGGIDLGDPMLKIEKCCEGDRAPLTPQKSEGWFRVISMIKESNCKTCFFLECVGKNIIWNQCKISRLVLTKSHNLKKLKKLPTLPILCIIFRSFTQKSRSRLRLLETDSGQSFF